MTALLHLVAALVATLVAPLWVLLLAPLLLGVPHVVEDLRQLVVRGSPRLPVVRLALPLGGMVALRIVSLVGGPRFPRLELLLGAAAVLVAVAVRPVAVAVVLPLAGLAWAYPGEAALAFGHAHNLVAVGFWWVWSRGAVPDSWRRAAVGFFAVAYLGLLAGLFDGVVAGGLAGSAAGLDLDGMRRVLAPAFSPTWGTRLVVAFAFAQMVHYSVWVALLPGAATPGRGWAEDLGPAGARVAVAGALFLPALGLWDPPGARAAYLSLVLFHGWLELAVAAHLWEDGVVAAGAPA